MIAKNGTSLMILFVSQSIYVTRIYAGRWLLINLLSVFAFHAVGQPIFGTYHGEQQVSLMLSDRQGMAQYKRRNGDLVSISHCDTIFQWCAKAYSIQIGSSKIEWDSNTVKKDMTYISDHSIPYKGMNGMIRVRDQFKSKNAIDRKSSFEELWAAVVFELLNIRNADNFIDNFEQAIEGSLSRTEWIRMNTSLEFMSLLELNKFYRQVWLPWADENNYESNAKLWGADLPNSYEEWYEGLEESGWKNYTYWGDYFDIHIANLASDD